MGIVRLTFRMEPVEDDRTRLSILLTGHMPKWPDFLGRPTIKLIFTKLFNYGAWAMRAKTLIEQETARTAPTPAAACARASALRLLQSFPAIKRKVLLRDRTFRGPTGLARLRCWY